MFLLALLSGFPALLNTSFEGKIAGDFFAECRVHTAQVLLTELSSINAKAAPTYRLEWAEQGAANGPYTGTCENLFNATLVLQSGSLQTDSPKGEPVVFSIRYDFFSTDSFSQAVFSENKLSIRSTIDDSTGRFPFGTKLKLDADFLFSSDESGQLPNQQEITYARSMRPERLSPLWVTGHLKALAHSLKTE